MAPAWRSVSNGSLAVSCMVPPATAAGAGCSELHAGSDPKIERAPTGTGIYTLSRRARATASARVCTSSSALQAREPLADRVNPEEQLPRDVRLVFHRESSAQHFALASGRGGRARR